MWRLLPRRRRRRSVALPLQPRPIMNGGDDSEDSPAPESPPSDVRRALGRIKPSGLLPLLPQPDPKLPGCFRPRRLRSPPEDEARGEAGGGGQGCSASLPLSGPPPRRPRPPAPQARNGGLSGGRSGGQAGSERIHTLPPQTAAAAAQGGI